ncbi:MAG: phospholipid carrier-dependent glycosyltransferase, partial [Anaerolineae bacterium]|nr:phospholipid carrier-dependent glycosyltransferase [Anaerolineae bacterium]NIN97262.1 phospholipid carrier-dependent glycosyltransferase [Anaerolineae bacterium]NIQ80192.1 phospholipid carrier-dependent glycosyltransferase [Anaerolineae bacterium]
VLTVLVFYFLAREMFSVPAAQVGTFLLAVSRWHVNFSRIAFVDNMLVPLFEATAIYFLWRGLRDGRRLDFLFAGLSFGLGFHTYLGYRVFPLVMGLYLFHLVFSKKGLIRKRLRGLAIFALATFMTLSPLALYAVQKPQIFVRRAEAASVQQDIDREGSYRPLLENVRKSLLMYNREGDPRARHNLPHEPMLDGLSAIFFGLGLGYSMLRWRHDRYFLLVAWLFLGLLPGILSLADSNPHSLRTLGNVPVVFLLMSAFWDRAWVTYAPWLRGRRRRYLSAGVAVILALSCWSNFDTYFNQQASHESVYYDFDPVPTAAGEFVKVHGQDNLVLISQALTNHSDLKFIPYGIPFADLDLNAHLPLRQEVDADVIYVLELSHASLVPRLQSLYPGGDYVEHLDRYGRTMFYTYMVTQQQVMATQGLRAAYYQGRGLDQPPALERVDRELDFSWDEPPLPPPFSALWQGSLYVPAYGSHTFVVEATGRATLRVGAELELTVDGGREEKSIILPAGFHPIEVEAVQEREGGHLRVSWVRPWVEEEVVLSDVLYVPKLYGHGLLGMYRAGTTWDGEPAVRQLDPFIAPNDVLSASSYSIEWLGKIYIPLSGPYAFGTVSDDGSYLYLDGQLVVDNGGHHGDVYREGRIQLEEGFHDIRLLYFQDGGGRKIELYWTPPGNPHSQVPPEQLFPPGVELTIPPPLPTPVPATLPTPPASATAIGGVAFEGSWGELGDGPGQFKEPRGVAVSLEGTVYVADTGNGRVLVFDASGEFLKQWGQGVLAEPFDLALDGHGQLYVVDPGHDRLFVYSADGELLSGWGEGWWLFDPRGVGVDQDGYVYVANTGGSVVLRVSPQGEVVSQYGSLGSGEGQLNQPTDVAVDDEGNLYVVDTDNARVQVFDSEGRYLRQWPISPANTFESPHIVWGMSGLLFLTDPEMGQVWVYDEQGKAVAFWGEKGSQEGQFSKPIGVGFDQRVSVYVADTYNHRIQKFQLSR